MHRLHIVWNHLHPVTEHNNDKYVQAVQTNECSSSNELDLNEQQISHLMQLITNHLLTQHKNRSIGPVNKRKNVPIEITNIQDSKFPNEIKSPEKLFDLLF